MMNQNYRIEDFQRIPWAKEVGKLTYLELLKYKEGMKELRQKYFQEVQRGTPLIHVYYHFQDVRFLDESLDIIDTEMQNRHFAEGVVNQD